MNAEPAIRHMSAVEAEQRTVGRLGSWWLPKVSPALALAYCASLVLGDSGWVTIRSIAVVAFVGLCVGTYGFVLNDIFDIEVDLRAGKRNRLADISPAGRFLLCAGALAMGFAPTLLVPTSHRTIWMLGIEYSILTIYSVPPFRVKTRGFWGMLCDCSGSHLGASLYTLAVIADGRAKTSVLNAPNLWVFVAVVMIWQLCLGLTGILIHQVEDRENDIRSGITTFATKHTFAQIRVPMSWVNAGEWLAFTSLCVLLLRIAPLLAVAAAIYVGILSVKLWHRWSHFRHVQQQSTLIEWWQFSHPFYEAYFPLAAAIQCAWIHPQIALLVPLHGVAFVLVFRLQLRDTRGAWTLLAFGKSLDVNGTARAGLRPILFPRWAQRIVVAECGAEPWEIRVFRPRIRLVAGHSYEITLTIRAEQPRQSTIGVWQDHDPWRNLGLMEHLSLTAEWQTICRTFRAQDDDAAGYLGLWLGGDAGWVEVRKWMIRKVAAPLET